MGPTCKARGGFDRKRRAASQIDIHGSLHLLHQYGLALPKPQGSKEKTRRGYRAGDRIRSRDLLWSKVLILLRSSSEPERAQIARPIGKGNREKNGLRPPRQRKKKKSRRSDDHTWPHRSEPGGWLVR